MSIPGTFEELEKEYEGRELDERWFQLQSALGTEDDAAAAYDDEGNFHCIKWWNCDYCPARWAECFL